MHILYLVLFVNRGWNPGVVQLLFVRGMFIGCETALRQAQGPTVTLRHGGRERGAFLPNSKKRMDARLSSVQNCIAVLQYPKKSMEGFFWVVRRRGAPLVPRSGMRVTEGRKGGGA